MEKTCYRGNLIGAKFEIPSKANAEIHVLSPSDKEDEVARIPVSFIDVDRAVDVASRAFRSYRKTPMASRLSMLKCFQGELKRRSAELVAILSRETGKPAWEAQTEVNAAINKVDITINESLKLVEQRIIDGVMDRTRGVEEHRPLGVIAVVGPFNFPVHLPNGHIVPALMMGNTVIFKPSEKTPLSGQLLIECYQSAGFPEGVVQMVQGEKEVGRRLCVHEAVSGVLFTGSYEVGVRIKQDTLQQHWKLVALEMGGKNPALILDDADVDCAVQECLVSSFITAGQRCSATSRILVHSNRVDEFVSKFHEAAKKFKIGHYSQSPFMGPLIDESSVDRFIKFQGIATRESYELIMRGKALSLQWKGNYVTPAIALLQNWTKESIEKSVFFQSEVFAPCVGIVPFQNNEEALFLANSTQYGLVASVFSKSEESFHRLGEDLEFGLLNWNRGTVGASSRLPFGGLKKSGNHFPTAYPSPFYCSYPVARLETAEPMFTHSSYPGICG